VLCETAKNGGPKPRLGAFQFAIRYSLNGKRKLDPAATLDGTILNQILGRGLSGLLVWFPTGAQPA
jgi:hypothetical protein